MSDTHKPSLCQVKGVVYQCVCLICDVQHKLDPSTAHGGRYIGETARTLAERADEHKKGLRRFDMKNFLVKHWALQHPELLEAPKFKFSVVKKHSDALSRMIQEAILILNSASMNSRSEWKGYKIARLSVSQSEWQKRKDLEMVDQLDQVELGEMLRLKDRVIANARTANINASLTYRKRMADNLDASDVPSCAGPAQSGQKAPDFKRRKVTK